jgi:L-ascorbate metabolism protein UlaG (beta-lactamase superfamily)
VEIRLIRHATLLLTINGSKIIVDPMLSPANAMDSILNTPNQKPNPLVELPLDRTELKSVIGSLDAILVTHSHFDHWDDAAKAILPKQLPVFCIPEDRDKIIAAGFQAARPIDSESQWGDVRIIRTEGRHGEGEIGQRMGPISGFIFKTPDMPTIYVAGDTIWCAEVENALKLHQPDIIVVNAGAAQFNTGGPITMTAEGVIQTARTSPNAHVIAVHMGAINHCVLSRSMLREQLLRARVPARITLPQDGDRISID